MTKIPNSKPALCFGYWVLEFEISNSVFEEKPYATQCINRRRRQSKLTASG